MTLSPGTRLGAFEILALAGTGGMGEVYRARDTRLDRTVALKVLTSAELEAASSKRIERFRQEARAIARITHPNICTLYDVAQEGSTTFLVMEFVEGTTLARRLEEGPLPLAAALKIAIQIADALDHAHRQGVVHRDLKPSNIMLARDRVKLLDFGLAKLKEPDERAAVLAATATQLTDAHTIVGTAPYMAPEQIEGREVDARTDIFAFGIVLYEMIAGRRPFQGDSRISVLAAIVGAEPPSLAGLQPLTPPSLERLVTRCLAKDPEDRWQTARDLAAELRWIAESPSAAGLALPALKRRSRRALLITGVLAAAAGAALVGATLMLIRPQPSVAAYNMVSFRHGIVSSARFAPDGNIVYSASWDGQPYEVFFARAGSGDVRALEMENGRILSISRASEMAVLFGQQVITHSYGPRTLARVPLAGGARRDLLEGVVDADWIPNTNDLAVVRTHSDGKAHVEFPIGTKVHESAAAWSLRVSPDGQRVAFFEGPVLFGDVPEATITVVDRAAHKSTLAREWTGMGLAWSPSGREVWFTATRGPSAPSLHAVSLSGVLRPLHAAADWLLLNDVSRDGQVLLTRNTIKWSIICQPPGETTERDLTWLGGARTGDLSLDGQRLVFEEGLYGRLRLPVIFQRGIAGTPAIRLGEGYVQALSPDGRWALALADGSFTLLPTGAGSARALEKGSLASVENGRWLPDGKHIVFAGRERGENKQPRIYVQPIDSGAPRPITPEGGPPVNPEFVTPDGQAVLGFVFGEPTPRLYPINGGGPREFPALKARDLPIRWSTDGKTIYAVPFTGPWRKSVDVLSIDMATGRRSVWKTFAPADPVGVDIIGRVVMTPDARAYCYSYMRRLGALFTVDGLK